MIKDEESPLPQDVTYDRYGRMKFHPEFHSNNGKPWTVLDQKYLIENYDALGPEQVSFALERTIHTIMNRAYELRKMGLMTKSSRRKNHRRIKGSIKGNSDARHRSICGS